MIKTNIKMRVTPEQSAKVQEICFENGIDWQVPKAKAKTLTCINEPFIFVKENKYLTWLAKGEESSFMKAQEEEIDPDLFIRTNGSYSEWKRVPNPDLATDKEIEQKSRGDGGSTNYYELPKGATELRHLIRHKKMSHSIGEIFCAIYRLNDNGEYLRNLKKAKFYIDSEIEEYEKENK